ncbi:MAG: hypothetical protein ABIG42_10255, partial [bacterium]
TTPVSPSDPGNPFQNENGPTLQGPNSDQILPWLKGTMIIDPSGEASQVIIDRSSDLNINITWFLAVGCPGGCFTYKIVGVNGTVLEIELKIENPSSIQAYDVRLIYQELYGKTVMNPDSYTDMWKPYSIQPFTAFATSDPDRAFPVGPGVSDTQTLFLDFPGGANPRVDFAIAASLPGQTGEPYEINSMAQTGTLTPSGGSAVISCNVLDHQGDITFVAADTSVLTGSYVFLNAGVGDSYSKTISNTMGAPVGTYIVPMMARSPNSQFFNTYNYFTLTVSTQTTGWSDPIVVVAEGKDDILPRLVLKDNEYWVIYTDGDSALSKYSLNDGATWSGAMMIGAFGGIDTLHAVLGGDNGIYVQYQRSSTKNTLLSKHDGVNWSVPVDYNYHGLTVQPYSCDLGITADGYIYDQTTGSWSAMGFKSTAPYTMSFADNKIMTFYHAIYSANDGFVQQAAIPKFFYIHEESASEIRLEYAADNAGWTYGPIRTGSVGLYEPAIAPESDGPYHGVMAVEDGAGFDLEYFRYATLPGTEYAVTIEQDMAGHSFHSISVEGNMVSVLYDADGAIKYVESTDGGNTFGAADVLEGADCMYSHVRRDAYSDTVVAAYSKFEDGFYNIYIRKKN